MRIIKLEQKNLLSDEETAGLAGHFMDDSHYDTLLTEDADVIKPDGDYLIRFRKKVFPTNLAREAYNGLRDAAVLTDNRGIAAGIPTEALLKKKHAIRDGVRIRQIKADGTKGKRTRAKPVASGITGFFDRQGGAYPYCRLTSYNMNHADKFKSAIPFISRASIEFKRLMPDRYANQEAMIKKTDPDFFIKGSVFTTVTVNKNYRTACHKDAGDLKAGFGVMSCCEAGDYGGGYLVFPKFRCAVDLRSCDILLADVGHEWHGNTKLEAIPHMFERISFVFYYRQHMIKCGSLVEELARAKERYNSIPEIYGKEIPIERD